MAQPYLCTECHAAPQAPNGWFLCWDCEARMDAQRLITQGERLIAVGRAKLATVPTAPPVVLGPWLPPLGVADRLDVGKKARR